jgi:hypothetical protein
VSFVIVVPLKLNAALLAALVEMSCVLVLRPGNALTKSREFLEDGVSGSSPHEGV